MGWVANAPTTVHSEAAGSTALGSSVTAAASATRDDGSLTFEQTGDPLLLIGRDRNRRRQGDQAAFPDLGSFQ